MGFVNIIRLAAVETLSMKELSYPVLMGGFGLGVCSGHFARQGLIWMWLGDAPRPQHPQARRQARGLPNPFVQRQGRWRTFRLCGKGFGLGLPPRWELLGEAGGPVGPPPQELLGEAVGPVGPRPTWCGLEAQR